jgi:hypothetical protein
MDRTSVFWEERSVSRVAVDSFSVRVHVNPQSIPEVHHGAVRWKFKLQGKSNEIDFA